MESLAVGLFLAFLIADGLLFSAVRRHYPEVYEKLGNPDFLARGSNPLTILRCLLFIFGSSPFKGWLKMTMLFRLTQLLLVSFLACMIGAIIH